MFRSLHLTPEQRQACVEALQAGKKIEAIKQLREMSGLGLTDAKQLIDELEAELSGAPPKRVTLTASKGSCVTALIIIVAMTGLVIYLLQR